jgi:GT2 family glycosyltransferase
MEIAVLLTCHNRKETTVQCLRALFASEIPQDIDLHVYLVDDGSTDGTSDAVKFEFPEVRVISGDGNLYWNRGMYLAWDTAAQSMDYDFYLWLNDDTTLHTDSLSVFLRNSESLQHNAIVVGSTNSLVDESVITYGGRTFSGELIKPTHEPFLCSYFNGNIVLIPKYVFEKIGMNDPYFHHALGDFDYGLRASKMGVKSYVATGILGLCDLPHSLPKWCDPQISFRKRWLEFRTPLGHNPEEFFVFENRHGGLFISIFHYATAYLKVLCPWLWNL